MGPRRSSLRQDRHAERPLDDSEFCDLRARAQEVPFDKGNCFYVLHTRTRARLTWCRPK